MLRKPEVALAVLAFGVYAYFFQAGGWNQNSRFDLVRAIVEQHSIVIDDYAENTGDKSVRDGRTYSDKAPGLSALAVPIWWTVHAFTDDRPRRRHIDLGAYLCTLWGVSLVSALGVAMLFRIAVRWGAPRPAAAVLAVSYAFGSQALPYATLFYSHQLVAGLLLLALAIVVDARDAREPPSRPRMFLVGILLGYSVASEYPAVLGAGAVAAYATFYVRRWQALAWIPLGAAIPILALAAYHTAAWGHPLTTGYSFHVVPGRDTGTLLPGVTLPDPALLPKILFSLERGIVRFSPWLAFALPGAFLMIRSRTLRAEGLLCSGVIALFLAFNCAQTVTPDDWRGGAGIGPRYVVPSLPFYALALVGLVVVPRGERGRGLRAWWAVGIAIFITLVALSVSRMVLATAVAPEVSRVDDPFADYLIPLWRSDQVAVNPAGFTLGGNRDGKHAWNLGEILGLSGRASLIPLCVYALAAGALVVLSLKKARAQSVG